MTLDGYFKATFAMKYQNLIIWTDILFPTTWEVCFAKKNSIKVF